MAGSRSITAKDFISTTIDSQDARAGANLLHEEARLLAQEGQGRPGPGGDGRGILVSGCAVGDEPLIISQLIRMACQAVAVQTLERVLAQGEPSAGELKKMHELLEEGGGRARCWFIAARGERALEHEVKTPAPKSGDAKLSDDRGDKRRQQRR